MPIDLAQINRSDLARKTGVDLAHISRIFAGRSKPGIQLAVNLARELHCTVDDLCESLQIVANDSEPTH